MSTIDSMLNTEGVDFLCPRFGIFGGGSVGNAGGRLSGVCERGGRGGASSKTPSGHEFRLGVVASVGVAIECRKRRGDGGFVRDRSRV